MTFAHHFDTQSELVLDSMMCTETCPCFYEVTFEENAKQVQTYRSDAYYSISSFLKMLSRTIRGFLNLLTKVKILRTQLTNRLFGL